MRQLGGYWFGRGAHAICVFANGSNSRSDGTKLFTAQTYLALGAMCLWLWAVVSVFVRNPIGPHVLHQSAVWWVLASGLCSLILEFLVAPKILLRENLAFWHQLGSGLYLLQGLGVAWALYKDARRFNR